MATKENLKKNSETYYEKEDSIGKYLSKTRNNVVLKHCKGHVVDLGCGDNLLLSQYPNESTGIDIVDYGSADIVLKNFKSLPFEDNSIDTVIIVASLNYFEEPISVLKEIRRIIKDKGQLVITMPNATVMKVWHKFRESWAHKSGYSYKEIQNLMSQSGLEIVESHPFLFYLNHVYIIHKK